MPQDHILIADDEPDIVAQVRDKFIENGYRTICATNGIEAWEELFRHPDEIAACVLDLQMPPGSLGGKDLVAKIRRGFSTLLPIVIYSGRGTISSSHEVTKAGADAFVEKEAGTQQLIDVVTKLISEHARPVAPIPSALNELARTADLPSLALKSFMTLERFMRTSILSSYTPHTLRSLFEKRGHIPSPQVMAKLNDLADFTNEKKLAFGDLFDLVTAMSACQLHHLPPVSVLRALKVPIVEVRNDLFHGREVNTRNLVVAITSTEDLLDKLGRDR